MKKDYLNKKIASYKIPDAANKGILLLPVFKLEMDYCPATSPLNPYPPSHPKWPEVSRGYIKPHYNSYGLLYDFIKPKINTSKSLLQGVYLFSQRENHPPFFEKKTEYCCILYSKNIQ
ncbi:MAG: hypothetical protein JSS98_11385 [Bacteroidetes bacterium]|nr:hypothetical protein [Bacteroidota bacterium]